MRTAGRPIAALLAAGAALAAAGAASANPLRDELSQLVREHPQIRAAEKTSESVRQEIGKAQAGYLPRLSVTGDTGPEVIDSPAERAQGDDKVSSRQRYTAGANLTQNLFAGGATTAAVRQARLNHTVARATLEGTRQNALFEAIGFYIDVLRQRRLIELARGNEANITRQLNLEDERVQRGSGVAVDVLQAKSRLQVSKERRVTFEGALENAISRYANVYNHPPNLDRMMDPVAPVELIPSTLEAAIENAIRENPAVVNAQATVAVAQARHRGVFAEYSPSLDFVTALNFEKDKNAVIGVRRDYAFLLQATWNLFTGFSTQASATQTAYDYRAAKDNLEFVMRRITEQTKRGWQDLLTARARLELLENAVNIASEVFESRKKLREAGKETVINVLDAENEIFNAQINFTGASYDERLAVYQLLHAMGWLDAAHLDLVVD